MAMDNWYTSYPLAKELLSKRLTIVRTLKRNKAEVPIEFILTKTKNVYSPVFEFQKFMALVSYMHKKSKCVVLLSTMHREEAFYESDNKKKSELIQFYNETKVGVDIVNEMSSSYSTA